MPDLIRAGEVHISYILYILVLSVVTSRSKYQGHENLSCKMHRLQQYYITRGKGVWRRRHLSLTMRERERIV